MYENMCLVLDMGGNQSAAIARMVRGDRVYSEVLPADQPIERVLKRTPRGLILAGDAAEHPVNPQIYTLGLPILGIGLGARALGEQLGVRRRMTRTGLEAGQIQLEESPLFTTLSGSERLLNKLDILDLPENVRSIASYQSIDAVAFECTDRAWYGMQFYPEKNDPDGLIMLHNFATGICGCEQTWTLETFLDAEIDYVREKLGDTKRVLMSISGGVDSAVCAMLLHRAVGARMTCVLVDTGFLQADEDKIAGRLARELLDCEYIVVDARERFMKKIQGINGTDEKCMLIREEMDLVLEEVGAAQGEAALAQGTTYADMLNWDETNAVKPTVKGAFSLVLEPISRLFKDEVRALGALMELPAEITSRRPFPGAGFAMRCGGCVTQQKIDVLRGAERILLEEMAESGQNKRVSNFFMVLADCRNAGPGFTLAIRALNPMGTAGWSACRLPYDLLERLVKRMTMELELVKRVVYDLTGSPPANAEWM